MLKMFKVSTLALFLFSSSAYAGMAFEQIKEELWFKGEQALLRPSNYALGEIQIVELPVEEAVEEVVEQIPTELEVALALWVAQK